MSSVKYENQILDAIETIVNNAVSRANYDKTIQGVISKCVDENLSKYVIKYQDSSFYAYGTDSNVVYTAGTSVYVLIPGNDMTQKKSIIGAVSDLGEGYIDITEGVDGYSTIGTNVITTNNTYQLCSYTPNGEMQVLYDKTDSSAATIDFNAVAVTNYLNQANYLIIGADFQTNLSQEQRVKGRYGIGFELNFIDNNGGNDITRTYILDTTDMLGNPYKYTEAINRKIAFEIDGINFKSVNKIFIFEYDFPNTSDSITTKDIFISNLTLEGANKLSTEEISGYSLTFKTPQGIYFDENDAESASREIQAEIRIKNKKVSENSNLLQYFWFKENNAVDTSHINYNRYGGVGWECLNASNIVGQDEQGHNLKEWLSGNNNFITTKTNNVAKINTYKCVVLYKNETIIEKEFIIYNYSSDYEITIESDSGIYFYYDVGHPTLTCYVNGEIPVNSTGITWSYEWGVTNNNNEYSLLPETDNTTGMRVVGNVIYNLQLSTIINFSTYKCAVYRNGIYVGKATITIVNSREVQQNTYSLVINHGEQIFKYNERGVAPNNKSLDNPQIIYPLSFTLFDEMKHEVDSGSIRLKDIFWTVPTEDTMIKVSTVHGNPVSVDPVEKTATYTEYATFNFDIPTLYSANKTRNTIQLTVKYKDKIVSAKTDLAFLKEGESGSNGTDFICRIIPNVADNTNIEGYPTIFYNSSGIYNLNYTPLNSGVWFKTQFWHDGNKIYDGATSGTTTENKLINIKWEILQNKYTSLLSDYSNFSVNATTGVFTFTPLTINGGDSQEIQTRKSNPANIIKCTVTYNGQVYYATMPLISVLVSNLSMYKVLLQENSGFRHAMYTTDGILPIYDNNNPFTLIVKENNNDISISSALTYTWDVKGLIYNNSWTTETNLILKQTLATLGINQKEYQPKDSFNGFCVSNALVCTITKNSSQIAKIHIPIQLYLNRYGNSALNTWDGNHIEINNNGGFILAPQVGAGDKDNSNRFTGVFMGKVQESGKASPEYGLYGYHQGARTIALSAEDGSARFGKAGKGQIVLDPTDDTAVIRSGDYVAPTIDSHGNITQAGSGLEIDLTDPHIIFGSGKFRVDNDGSVHATEYTTIADLEAGTYDIPSSSIEVGTDKTLDDYMSETGTALEDLQSQIDGNITTWFYSYAPTLNNPPVTRDNDHPEGTDWDTDTKKDDHLGDLFYDLTTGYCYRFMKSSGVYSWGQLSDSDISAALAAAQTAQQTADVKKRVFYNTPNPPYDLGDLWVQGSSGDILRCATAKTASQSYSAGDWVPASKYTDDTTLNNLKPSLVSSTLVEYALSISASTAPTTGWNVQAPVWEDGKYMWQRTTSTYADGHSSTPTVTCIAGAAGQNAYTVVLTNENQSIAATSNGAAVATTITTGVIAYKGATQKTTIIGANASATSFDTGVTGITAAINNNNTASASITFTVTTSLTTQTGSITIPITVDSLQFNKKFTFSLSKAGNAGRGISTTEIKYVNDNQGTTPPSDSAAWQNNPPADDNNKRYLWTRTKITYTDNQNPTTSYSVSYKGVDGTSVTITSQIIEYAEGNNGTIAPSSGWSTSIPLVEDGKYLWTRTTVNYSGGTSTVSYSVSYQSEDGQDATQYYTHVMYATSASGANISSSPTGKTYMGVRVDTTQTASTNPNDYTWTKFVGDDATQYYTYIRYSQYSDGHDYVSTPTSATKYIGVSVTTATSAPAYSDSSWKWSLYAATQYYTYVRYASSSTPAASDISTSSVGKTYMGVVVTTATSAPTTYTSYTWTKFVGDDGQPGSSGQNAYTYIRYSANSDGSNMVDTPTSATKYVGLYAGNSATVPAYTEFTWSKYAGDDATQYYTYIRYASSMTPQAADISIDSTGKKYVGTAITTSSTAPTTYTSYQWSKIVGEDGFSVWTTTTTPSSNKIAIANLTGPTGVTPRIGEHIIRSNRYQYTITAVSSTEVTVGTEVDLRGQDGNNGTSIVWKGDLSSAPSNPQNLWAYYNTIDKKSYIYNGSSWTIMAIDGINGTNGTNATQYYYHVVYCNNTSTGSGYSTTPSNQIYTGTYTDTNVADAATWNALPSGVKWNYTKGDTGAAGVDATNIICGNEAQVIVCNSDGTVTATTAITIPFAGYVGNSKAACSVSYSTLPSGMTLTSNTAATASADGSLVLAVAANSTLDNVNNGIITLTFSCNNKTFTKTFSWSKAIKGATGATGATGTGIESIIEQYYLSTSKDSPTGGSWVNTAPAWEKGKYIWTRSEITYKNPTSVAHTTALCSSEWEAIDDIQIGGRNLLENSSVNRYSLAKWSSSNNAMTAYSNGGYLNYPYFNYSRDLTSSTSRGFIENLSVNTKIVKDDQIVISGYYRNHSLTSTKFQCWIRFSGGGSEYYVTDSIDTVVDNNWHYFEIAGVVGNFTYSSSYPEFQLAFSTTQNHNIDFCALKVEKGNKATDWTPAPEDSPIAIDVEYYLSTSNTTPTGGSWSTTAPTWVDGKYMWSRQKITYGDGTNVTTNQTCIAGATGATGSTGRGIASITEQYYLSTSKTSLSGGSWVETAPTWESGKYMWTRSKIVYQDPASTEYTTALCDSSWEAVNELNINSGNLLFNGQAMNNTNKAQWDGSFVATGTTDLPNSNASYFKFRTQSTTKYYIPFDKTKTYEVGTWIKAVNSSSTANIYPSIIPYDMDKQQMNYPDVYINNSKTVLTQDLHAGDTTVYADDLNNWSTTANSYSVLLAFYNYRSSTGYLYSNYTKNWLQLCEYGEDKTQYIHKDTNTITLPSAYSGDTIPAGTAIAQNSYGGTYIYPFGGFTYASIAEWTEKKKTFDYTFDSRLKDASYIKFYPYSDGAWYFAPYLIDVSLSSSIDGVNTYINQVKDDLQNQIDGAIQFWNGSSVPTLNNYPASDWTTEALRQAHQADIYTVIQDVSGELKQGKGYRFDKVNNVWTWVEITDQELSAVQALAASKAKVFVVTPTVPYNIGDLWLKDGDLYRCTTSKGASGGYDFSDWTLATDYTNDDTANAVQHNLDTLSIGGRNLAKNPAVYDRKSANITFSDNLITFSQIDRDTYFNINLHQQLVAEQEYTLSWECAGIADLTYAGLQFPLFAQSNPLNKVILLKNGKQSVTFSLPSSSQYVGQNYIFMDDSGTKPPDTNITIKNIQLEKGNRATDYTIAPEDVQDDINAVQTNLDNLEIGGRNLLKNSNTIYLVSSDQNTYTTRYNNQGKIVVTAAGAGKTANFYTFVTNSLSIPIAQLTTQYSVIAFSFDLKVTSLTQGQLDFNTNIRNGNNNIIRSNTVTYKYNEIDGETWFRVKNIILDCDRTARTDLLLFGQFVNANEGATIEYKNLMLEISNKSSDWSPAPEDTDAQFTSMTTYINGIRDNLQGQIDGTIQFWNGADVPTLSNYPASSWTTEALRQAHADDVYTVMQTVSGVVQQGKGYKFNKVSGTWTWVEISDTELSVVRSLAASKAQVFIKDNDHPNPTPPYNVGDLWLKDGDLYRCTNSRSSGSYSSSDWTLATDYTDDTKATAVETELHNMAIGGKNLLDNSNFDAIYTSTTQIGLGTNIYAKRWGMYNSGITDPTLHYHACIDTTTFGYNVCMYNESDGERNWKGINQSWSTTTDTYKEITIDDGSTFMLSMDVYQTMSGGKLWGGFYYTKTGESSPAFYSGSYAIATEKIPVGSWTRVSVQVPFNHDVASNSSLNFYVYGYNFDSNTIVYIKDLKLEKGNKSTNWTPAPSDGVKTLDVEYYLSDSNTSVTGGSWQTTAPQWVNGKYMWSRQKVTYGNGKEEYKNQTCIAGAKGDDARTYVTLQSGDDLNNLRTKDTVYVSTSTEICNSLLNKPTGFIAGECRVEIEWLGADIYVVQRLYCKSNTNSKIFHRTYYAGSWGAWLEDTARTVSVAASSQVFKSTKGAAGPFDPQYIYLYPDFVGCTYSKWQYSTNGSSWTDVTSGSNSLTIGTYNSIANVLRIERTCNLYTSAITSVSFKCISNDVNTYDTVTVIKVYDVTELKIGGENLLSYVQMKRYAGGSLSEDTVPYYTYNQGIITATNQPTSSFLPGWKINVLPGVQYTISVWSDVLSVAQCYYRCYDSDDQIVQAQTNVNQSTKTDGRYILHFTPVANTAYVNIGIGSTSVSNYTEKVKLEQGNVGTDWSPYADDVDRISVTEYAVMTTNAIPNNATTWTNSLSGFSNRSYVWQRVVVKAADGTVLSYGDPSCIYTPSRILYQTETQYTVLAEGVSPSSQTTWSSSKPLWTRAQANQRLWVRIKYTYKNPDSIEYSIPYQDTAWSNYSEFDTSINNINQTIDSSMNGTVEIKGGVLNVYNASPSSGHTAAENATAKIIMNTNGIGFATKSGNNWVTKTVWGYNRTSGHWEFDAEGVNVLHLSADEIEDGILTLKGTDLTILDSYPTVAALQTAHPTGSLGDAYYIMSESCPYTWDTTTSAWVARPGGEFLLSDKDGKPVCAMDINGFICYAVDNSYVQIKSIPGDDNLVGLQLYDANKELIAWTDTQNGIWKTKNQVIEQSLTIGTKIKIVAIGNGIGFIAAS